MLTEQGIMGVNVPLSSVFMTKFDVFLQKVGEMLQNLCFFMIYVVC